MDLSHIRTGLRVTRCQHHYIYCVKLAKTTPLIIAILHERMDLIARISERLE
jgi:toxin ParE1/3/4